ncbi:hypothetical protein BDK51DRAFT_26192, partial [Blyttiomyces helicus]
IPITTLATFKRMSLLTRNPTDILAAAALASDLLEAYTPPVPLLDPSVTVSPTALALAAAPRIRRKGAYTLNDLAVVAAKAALSQNRLEAEGFAEETTDAEVKAYFSAWGAVKECRGNKGIFLIEFENVADMVKALAVSHTYEDARIKVRGRSKNSAAPAFVAPPPTAVKLDRAGILETRSGIHSFARGRVLEVKFEEPDSVTGPDVRRRALKAIFEGLAPVTSIDFERGVTTGHVRFKKGVARNVLSIIAYQGGLTVAGDTVQVRVLEDEEERLFWEVAQEREKNAPPPPTGGSSAPASRSGSRTRGRARRGRATGHRGSTSDRPRAASAPAQSPEGTDETPGTLNANRKRVLGDDAADMGSSGPGVAAAGGGRKVRACKKGRIDVGGNKRVKVDPLEDMFKTLTVGMEGLQGPEGAAGQP